MRLGGGPAFLCVPPVKLRVRDCKQAFTGEVDDIRVALRSIVRGSEMAVKHWAIDSAGNM